MAKKLTDAEKKAIKRIAKAKKANKPVITKIPEFFDDDGQLRTLKQGHFPNTKDGKMAYCDFQVAKREQKKLTVAKRMDPQAKLRRKREKLQETLRKLEEKLAEAEAQE